MLRWLQVRIGSLLLALVLTPTAWGQTSVIQGGAETATGSSYNENFMQGYDFVATTDLSLTALGIWDSGGDGLPRAFQVGLWATATQTLLASASIDNADPLDGSVTIAGGQYRYETLGLPVTLTSGTTYTLAFQVGAPNLSATDSLLIDYPTLVPHPNVTIDDDGRFLETASFTFPTDPTGPVGNSFRGMANAQLTAVPEPSTMILCGLVAGSAAFAYRRRRGKADAKGRRRR